MSVLNQASDGTFNVLIVLVRTLVRFGPNSREELIGLCGGKLAQVDDKYLNAVLTRWQQLGLLESEDRVIRFREPYLSSLGDDPDIAEFRLPSAARAILLLPENNEQFWEAEKSLSADLSRAMSWFLAQDVYAIDAGNYDRISRLESEQVLDKSRCVLQNNTRWNGLRAWMTYLGFARLGAPVTPDPTSAIMDVLADVFADDTTLLAPEFTGRLAKSLPVLDGGEYRVQVENVLDPSRWRRPTAGRLSTSLSRALKRLHWDGVISMENRHDAKDGLTLTGVNDTDWGRMTHIRLTNGAGGKL